MQNIRMIGILSKFQRFEWSRTDLESKRIDYFDGLIQIYRMI